MKVERSSAEVEGFPIKVLPEPALELAKAWLQDHSSPAGEALMKMYKKIFIHPLEVDLLSAYDDLIDSNIVIN